MPTRKLSLLLLTVCATLLSAIARADSQVRIVRLSYVYGDVQVDRRDGRGFERAFLNMPLMSAARLQTGNDARAEVEFEADSTIRMMPATRIEFTELTRRDSGQPLSSMELQQGTAYFNLHRKDKEEFGIEVGRREIRVSKATRFRLQLEGAEARLAVFNGELKVAASSSGDWVAVRKNETLTLDLDNAGGYILAKGVSPDLYDEWDKERDAYRDRYASSASNAPYGYGVSDLNYYGNYIYLPPYGYVWRPAMVSAAWSPFADGAWVWYPSFGYVWVSGYPWGWAPYHYGSWLFISGYGWCWNPRGGWGHWNNVSTVVDPPRGFTPPQPPPPGGSGIVVVGRGPSTGGRDGFRGRPPVMDDSRASGREERGRFSGSGIDVGAAASTSGGDSSQSAGAPVVRPNRENQAASPAAPVRSVGEGAGSSTFGGRGSDATPMDPSSPAPRSAPSTFQRSTSGGGTTRSSPSAVGRSSGSFGGSHSSSHSGGQRGGSAPRSNGPR